VYTEEDRTQDNKKW